MMIWEPVQVTTSQIGKRGFTLIELLVVVVIIITIAASVLTVVPGLSERANIKATRAFMDRLEIAIEDYYNDNSTYPSTGIASLKTDLEPSGSKAKQYIEFNDYEIDSGDIIDSFGNDFVYTYPGIQNTFSYDLYSNGPDGVTASFGTDTDDINNWSR